MTYSYSTDGELFDGEYETPEAAAAAAFVEDDNLNSVEVGENVKHPAKHYVSAQSIIDEMKCAAEDSAGEAAEDWLNHVTDEELAELEALVGEWAEKVDHVGFWAIKSPKTITRADLIARRTSMNAPEKITAAEPMNAEHYVSARSIVDDMKCAADDTAGEAAEDWLDYATEEQLAELEALVLAWVKEVDPPNF